MIVSPAARITPGVAAERLATAAGAVWLKSPASPMGDQDVAFFACAPVQTVCTDDLKQLEQAWTDHRERWGVTPARCPLAIGFLSYELGKKLVGGHHLPQVASGWPQIDFRFFDAVLAIESAGEASIFAVDEAAAKRLADRLTSSVPSTLSNELNAHLAAVEADGAFLNGVRRVHDYLSAGDCYQVNLARQLKAPLHPEGLRTGLSLALQLQADAPAPFGLWYGPLHAPSQGGARALVGNSPECFLRVAVDGMIETAPIKGTRQRTQDQDPLTDPAALLLVNSEKDRAEHDMIVDLERNDLGRLCATGSVQVLEHARLMHLPTLHHLVSTVRGRLRSPRPSLTEILAATFPGGSITGAPKRRAMEIICELETCERGPYTGATGWLGAAGDLELAVAIRTAAIADGNLVLWVGGGIVTGSDPAAELAETNTKAQAFSRLWRS